MKRLLRFLLRSIPDLLMGIGSEMVPALIGHFKELPADLKAFFSRQKLAHVDRNATNTGCGTLHHPAFHRPDPLVYSQQYLQKLGLAVTWDNPDITLLLNGTPVPEGRLLPDTDYEIDARIWNNSYDAPALGVRVEFGFYSFGAGTVLHPIGSRAVNLGVKGGPGHPAHARIPWRTPPAGHYCILVRLAWPGDLNPDNNVGQNNVDVVTPQSPAAFRFTLRNDTGRPQRYRFRTDAYALPPPPDCGPKPATPVDRDRRWREIQVLHDPAGFPVPPGWTVAVSPADVPLAPEAEAEIEVAITPPAGFAGRQAFNVHSLYGNERSAGGVTVYVSVP
jgi:hypothetical protein